MDRAEIDRLFFEDGYRLADQYLNSGINRDNILSAIRLLYEAMDGLIISLLQRSSVEGRPVECKNGCAWCCHQAVFAVSHELILIREFIFQNLKGTGTERIKSSAALKIKRTTGSSMKQRLEIKYPCPFLSGNSCSIYPVRPMACRIYLSTSRLSCESEFRDPGNEKNIPELLDFPLRTGRMLNEGFVSRLREAGLQCLEMPLENGAQSVLSAGDSLPEKWLKGELILKEMDYSDEDLKLLNRF